MTVSEYKPFEVGDWLVEPEFNRISRTDAHVSIQPKAMELLVYLARNNGHVVSADEILDDLWGDVIVASGSVYVCVSQLREALGDDSHHPAYIETIAKRGYRLIAPVRFIDEQDGDSDAPALTSTTVDAARKKALMLTGLLVLVLLVALYQFLDMNRAPSAPQHSVAVLPFTDLSPNGDQEYFADGIAEDLLNVLAQVPDLRVVARTSSFQFKGENPDITDIARRLNVAHVVEGSVRRDGIRVRVTAQLVDAETGFHLWSATYDRELDDIFATQDEISVAIVDALSETLGFAMVSPPKVQQTANSAAYDEYLLGILYMRRRGGDSLEAAKQHLERALALEPNYAPAHARLSITIALLPQYNNRYTRRDVEKRRGYHVERAMTLAPDTPESLAARGFYYYAWNTGSFREVRATFERVVELNSSYTDVLIWLANTNGYLGDYQAKMDLYAQALRVDPLNALVVGNNAVMLMNADRFEESRALIDRLRTLSPPMYRGLSADLASRQGLIAEAALYCLETLAIDSTGRLTRNLLANLMTFGLGLADETSDLDHRNWGVMIENGQIEEVLVQAEDAFAVGFPGAKGDVLLAVGRPGEAVGYLNQSWDQALSSAMVDRFGPTRLVNIGRARQSTGHQAGGREALEAALAVTARRRAAGIRLSELDWAEGLALYFLGRKEAGMRLVARAVDRRFVGYLMQPQFQPLTSDPGFAPIQAARDAYAATEREKFLTIICNGGNPAPEVWTPKPETCAEFDEG